MLSYRPIIRLNSSNRERRHHRAYLKPLEKDLSRVFTPRAKRYNNKVLFQPTTCMVGNAPLLPLDAKPFVSVIGKKDIKKIRLERVLQTNIDKEKRGVHLSFTQFQKSRRIEKLSLPFFRSKHFLR